MIVFNPTEEKAAVTVDDKLDVERASMYLALARSQEEEEELKEVLRNHGFRVAVFEIGGLADELRQKMVGKLIGAALNNGVIRKSPDEVHALMHATVEAERGLLLDVHRTTSLALKVVAVRRDLWLAVAMFGESAIHVLTNHRRAGLGVMHVSN